MKILHSADWHLDSPIQGRTPEQTAFLKARLLEVPHRVAAAAKAEGCDLMLLSGDLFDGPSTPESVKALRDALQELPIPTFIVPGNHDFLAPGSPWQAEAWPAHVHIFRSTAMEAVAVEALNCTVYGAAFTGPESPALLENFRAGDGIAIGILHGDPTQASSPYCPVTAEQVAASNLDYLALGHIHKGGQLRSGKTLCAWPGCPMGRGFDELDSKGVLIVTGENGQWDARFRALDTPRFFDLECEAGLDPAAALGKLLPAAGSQDFYRVTFTGEAASVSLPQLQREFDRFPNLTLRDRTVPPVDPWASAGDDTLEGVYFQMLHDAMDGADEEACRRILLAAKISRSILEGREVTLP